MYIITPNDLFLQDIIYLKALDDFYFSDKLYLMKDIQNFTKENKVVTYYFWILVSTIFFLWVVNRFNISYPISVTTKTASELAVVGEGKVDIIPDTASVALGIIVNDAKTVDEAQNQINTVNNAIVAGVQAVGVDKKDVKTSNYSILPNYNYEKGGAGSITGYNGNVTVTIKIRDTAKLPEVIQAATKAGANQVMGTSYSVDRPEKYREQARQKAIDNAKEQAQKLASQLGIRLGKVTNIVESSGGGPISMFYEKSAMMGLDGTNMPAPDLQPGTQTITSTVTLYFDKR